MPMSANRRAKREALTAERRAARAAARAERDAARNREAMQNFDAFISASPQIPKRDNVKPVYFNRQLKAVRNRLNPEQCIRFDEALKVRIRQTTSANAIRRALMDATNCEYMA